MGLHDRHYVRQNPSGSGGIGGYGAFPGFGGGGPRAWSANTWIIVICVLVFVIDSLLFAQGVDATTELGRIEVDADGVRRVVTYTQQWPVLTSWLHFSTAKGLFQLEIWRLVGFQFLHGGMSHLLFNMIGLFFFGPIVERYLGKKRYAAFYLLTGVCGALFYLLLNLLGNMNVPLPGVLDYNIWTRLVGASAGVFGVLMAAAYLAPNATVYLMFMIPMRMSTLIYILVGVAAFTLLTSGNNAGGEAAHLGGAFAGFWLIRKPTRIWRAAEMVIGKGRPPKGSKPATKKPKKPRGQPSDEDIDRILAKVAMKGLHSLTENERKILRRATESRRK